MSGRFNGKVEEIQHIVCRADGTTERTRIFRRKRKRTSRRLRPAEKVVRRLVKLQERASKDYLDRHEKSNRRRRNGWVRDYGENVIKAYRKLDKEWVEYLILNLPVR